jgi:hypothetical protein
MEASGEGLEAVSRSVVARKAGARGSRRQRWRTEESPALLTGGSRRQLVAEYLVVAPRQKMHGTVDQSKGARICEIRMIEAKN